MTDTTQLTNQLTKLNKFNTDNLSNFSEFQKYIFASKRREFYLLTNSIRSSISEKESLKLLMKENLKVFDKGYKLVMAATIIGIALLWFFDASESSKNGFLIFTLAYLIFTYFNKRVIETQNNLHLVLKTDSIKFYEFLSNNLIDKGYLECEYEWKKLMEKRTNDFYQTEIKEETEEEKLIEYVFDAAVSRAIIEDITGEKNYSYMSSLNN